jgi:DNA gyrase subunit A
MQASARNGLLIRALAVRDSDEVMLITDQGTLLRTPVEQISLLISRNTQGVRLMNLREGESFVGVARIVDAADGNEGTNGDVPPLESTE